MASSSIVKVKLVSSAETGHFYTTTVNKKNMNMKEKKKLQFKKYDPVVRKHVVYNEEKMK